MRAEAFLRVSSAGRANDDATMTPAVNHHSRRRRTDSNHWARRMRRTGMSHMNDSTRRSRRNSNSSSKWPPRPVASNPDPSDGVEARSDVGVAGAGAHPVTCLPRPSTGAPRIVTTHPDVSWPRRRVDHDSVRRRSRRWCRNDNRLWRDHRLGGDDHRLSRSRDGRCHRASRMNSTTAGKRQEGKENSERTRRVEYEVMCHGHSLLQSGRLQSLCHSRESSPKSRVAAIQSTETKGLFCRERYHRRPLSRASHC